MAGAQAPIWAVCPADEPKPECVKQTPSVGWVWPRGLFLTSPQVGHWVLCKLPIPSMPSSLPEHHWA